MAYGAGDEDRIRIAARQYDTTLQLYFPEFNSQSGNLQLLS